VPDSGRDAALLLELADMKIDPEKYRVAAGEEVSLEELPTRVEPFYKSKKHYSRKLQHDVEELSAQQRLLYADDRYALLLILQGMDAAGKDGTIGHIMSGVNPLGCEVSSFKQPTPTELAHDFLWRASRRLPERGRIGIFNRSHYEEVLVVRVHPELLAAQRLPAATVASPDLWQERFKSIVTWEDHLHRNGTRIVKVFLHLSKAEQRKRFLQRIDDPERNWKFSLDDVRERRFWNRYQKAYQDCLGATSTRTAPWHVVPADDKANARLIVSRIVIEALQAMELKYPQFDKARRRKLDAIRRALEQEKQ
jgi:PPK2 family polyphosphate:nucleotide phosphotransferase